MGSDYSNPKFQKLSQTATIRILVNWRGPLKIRGGFCSFPGLTEGSWLEDLVIFFLVSHTTSLNAGIENKTLFSMTVMSSSPLTFHLNWQKLFSYGEVVCFVSAWAVGLLIAIQGQQQPSNDRAPTRSFASATDSLGIQANLGR